MIYWIDCVTPVSHQSLRQSWLTLTQSSDSHSLTGIAKMVNYLKYQFSPVKSIYWWPTATDRVWTVADFDDAKFEG